MQYEFLSSNLPNLLKKLLHPSQYRLYCAVCQYEAVVTFYVKDVLDARFRVVNKQITHREINNYDTYRGLAALTDLPEQTPESGLMCFVDRKVEFAHRYLSSNYYSQYDDGVQICGESFRLTFGYKLDV